MSYPRDESRKLLDDLREAYPPVTHPLVRTRPETGRRALLWGGNFMRYIVGMRPEESERFGAGGPAFLPALRGASWVQETGTPS